VRRVADPCRALRGKSRRLTMVSDVVTAATTTVSQLSPAEIRSTIPRIAPSIWPIPSARRSGAHRPTTLVGSRSSRTACFTSASVATSDTALPGYEQQQWPEDEDRAGAERHRDRQGKQPGKHDFEADPPFGESRGLERPRRVGGAVTGPPCTPLVPPARRGQYSLQQQERRTLLTFSAIRCVSR
jgi:hypothetical protein